MVESYPNAVALYLGYTPKPLDPFSSILVTGLLSRLAYYQKDLIVFGSYRWQPQGYLYQALVQKKIDGVIFIPPMNHPLTAALAESHLPVVAVADPAPGIVSVTVNDEMGAFMLAEHLALRGYTRIMFRKDPYDHPSAVNRLSAFVKSAEYLGMEVSVTLPKDSDGQISSEEEKILLSLSPNRPRAVVCWSDTYAYATLKFCRTNNLNVPHDIAIAGFDGITPIIEPARKLTSIQAPWFRVAETAVDLIVQLSRGEQIIRETVLPIDLVIGDTT